MDSMVKRGRFQVGSGEVSRGLLGPHVQVILKVVLVVFHLVGLRRVEDLLGHLLRQREVLHRLYLRQTKSDR
jgi:hypothetical protein